jgi:uroporphyrin-III C-methyltransferase/precorrin-2 dehydrogenase/sirohydrochlorin ferrochelatase
MDLLPLFLKLEGRRVVLVAAGSHADGKRAALTAAGAVVRDVDPADFQPSDLDDAWLVIAAATAEVNAQIAAAAEARRIFVNAVDDPPNASAYLGGVVRRAGVTIAISTGGEAPALAGVLRETIDALLPEGHVEKWMAHATAMRSVWKSAGVPMSDRRPQLIETLKELYP